MRTRSAAIALVALATGCWVPRVDYRAEVSRVRALEHDRARAEARMAELGEQVRKLHQAGENLELERTALDEELVRVANELEEMRIGTLELQEELLEEREARLRHQAELQELTGTYQSLVEELESEVEAGQLEIHRLRGRLQVRALEAILFDSGSAEIKPEGREVLARVAREVAKIPNHSVRVEGHTDNVPIATARFPSNWELAATRAARVVRFLVEQGLEPAKLEAVGFGEHQAIAPNRSAEGRARNRRIEIVLVPASPE